MTDDFRGPAAKHFDWIHILERHSASGRIARQSGKKTVFSGLNEGEIKSRVRSAWRKRTRIQSQFDPLGLVERIQYRGIAAKTHEIIEFWHNVQTKIVETAYPVES